jgi:hypothetical protein
VVGFASSAVSVASDAPQVQLTLNRSGGSTGAITVSWAMLFDAPSTARAGVDVIPEGGTVAWANGDASAKTITITLADDGQPGPDRLLVVQLSSPTGGCVLDSSAGPPQAQVTLVEADAAPAGVVSCAVATETVTVTAHNAIITVNRNQGSTGSVSVDFITTAETAVEGQDYVPQIGTLSWANGDAAAKTIVVPLLGAKVSSGGVRFTVTLANATGGALIATASTDVTLVNPGSPSGGGCGSGIAFVMVALIGSCGLTTRRRQG